MKTFEDLDVFQKAVQLSVHVYRATQTFPGEERYSLTKQLRRAAVSVVSNVAEGQGRLTLGEWRQFLSHARGSLYEVQAQVILAQALGYLDDGAYQQLRSGVTEVAKPLAGLIEYVRRRASGQTTDN